MTMPVGGQSTAPDPGQSAGTGTQSTVTDPAAGGQSAPGATGATPPVDGQSTVSRAEFDQLRAQLAAADQRRAKAEQDFAQLRDKDMPALQKLERDLADATTALTERDAALANLRVENAFLTDNTYDWHNTATALQMLDRSKIQLDAEGNVVGMKDALKALATAHAYLLKPAAPDGGATPPAPPPPGTQPTNGGIAPQQGTKLNNDELGRRFPALRQRL